MSWYVLKPHCLLGTGHRKVGPRPEAGMGTSCRCEVLRLPTLGSPELSFSLRIPLRPGRGGALVSRQPGQHCVARVPGTGRPAHSPFSPDGEEGAGSPPLPLYSSLAPWQWGLPAAEALPVFVCALCASPAPSVELDSLCSHRQVQRRQTGTLGESCGGVHR